MLAIDILYSIYTERNSFLHHNKLNMDCDYTFPIDLVQNQTEKCNYASNWFDLTRY